MLHKTAGTGILEGLTVKNTTIIGGYAGISLSGTSVDYSQNIVIENNIITNQYRAGILLSHVNVKSISYNRISPRSAYQGTTWNALEADSLRHGGNIIGNHILANNTNGITANLRGLYIANNIDSALIANNEIYLNSNASYTHGIQINYPEGISIINNSIYTQKSGTSSDDHHAFYMMFSTSSWHSATVRNNIFVAKGGDAGKTYAIYLAGTGYTNQGQNYDIDYNNYYSAGNNMGYINITGATTAPRANLAAWQLAAPLYDAHSCELDVPFNAHPVDSGLVLYTYDSTLTCPRHDDVTVDIRNYKRKQPTNMGAYSSFTLGQDLALDGFSAWNTSVFDLQTIEVNIKLHNNGVETINTAEFGWTINNGTPQSFTWTAVPPLESLEERIVNIGSFVVSNTETKYDVVAWVNTVNGKADGAEEMYNDTTEVATANVVPLAKFSTPYVPDTITNLSFTVNAFINPISGANTTTPKMTIISTVHGTTVVYDTITMIPLNDTAWQATVLPQYYGTNVVYSIAVNDTLGNSITLIDSTYIRSTLSILGDASLTALSLTEPKTSTGCMPDYTPIKVELFNKDAIAYDYSRDSILIGLEIIDANMIKQEFTIPFKGVLNPGVKDTIELVNSFPTPVHNTYNIKVWLGSTTDNTPYKDTINEQYIAGKVSLPLDEDFSGGITSKFDIWEKTVGTTVWKLVAKGSGADSVVIPLSGDSLLSFTGGPGSMSWFAIRQMDLTRTEAPLLSFWYFHDTIPCNDYTAVSITRNGGDTYDTTLLTLNKYDTISGWKQYDIDLSTISNPSCVILAFEAMEGNSGDVVQYIDRIRITANQDVEITDIILPELTVCDLANKEVKVAIRNLSDPELIYANVPTTFTLEVNGQVVKDTVLSAGSLGSFAEDTITMLTDFDFTKGTYIFKAYFSSAFDLNQQNNTFVDTVVVNPSFSVNIHPQSGGNTNCLVGESSIPVWQKITIKNTGNMDLSNINMILQVDTGDNNPIAYALFKETYTDVLLAGDTVDYEFTNSYIVPWNTEYWVRTYVSLSCDSALVNSTIMITECVDTKDLRLLHIDEPSAAVDTVDAATHVTVTLNNRSDGYTFSNIPLTVVVANSQGVPVEYFTENTTVNISATVSYTFTRTYTVPDDTVYYLIVFVENQDNYSHNDTAFVRREIVKKPVSIAGINGSDVFTLSQNIPNPANSSTRIDYSIPEAGKVVFHVHNVSGQLLYSKTIEATNGKQSLELNTSTFAAGIYFYSIEYKGRRLVKRMMIND
jgi:hypothetical protein